MNLTYEAWRKEQNIDMKKEEQIHWVVCSGSPASTWVIPGSVVAFEGLGLGIQKVRTEEAAANITLRGAHFKQEATPT